MKSVNAQCKDAKKVLEKLFAESNQEAVLAEEKRMSHIITIDEQSKIDDMKKDWEIANAEYEKYEAELKDDVNHYRHYEWGVGVSEAKYVEFYRLKNVASDMFKKCNNYKYDLGVEGSIKLQ